MAVLRAPDLGSLLPRSLIYEAVASSTLGISQLLVVTATCQEPADIPLEGNCGVAGPLLVQLDGRAVNWSNAGVAAGYSCTFLNGGAIPLLGTARILCLGSPVSIQP